MLFLLSRADTERQTFELPRSRQRSQSNDVLGMGRRLSSLRRIKHSAVQNAASPHSASLRLSTLKDDDEGEAVSGSVCGNGERYCCCETLWSVAKRPLQTSRGILDTERNLRMPRHSSVPRFTKKSAGAQWMVGTCQSSIRTSNWADQSKRSSVHSSSKPGRDDSCLWPRCSGRACRCFEDKQPNEVS
jgi:hypothetical protein